MRNKLRAVFFINLVFIVYFILNYFMIRNVLLSICVNLMLFVIPGLSIIGGRKREFTGVIELIFYVIVYSLFCLLSLSFFLIILKYKVTVLNFSILLMVISNIFMLRFKGMKIKDINVPLKTISLLFFGFCIVYGLFYFNARTIPAVWEGDRGHISPTMGLIQELKPYSFSGMPEDTFDKFMVSCPLLSFFYPSYSILLCGLIDETQMSYHFSRNEEERPAFKVFLNGEEVWEKNIVERAKAMNKGLGVKTEAKPAMEVSDQILLAVRIPYVFAAALLVFILCFLIFELTKSSEITIAMGMLFVSLPEIFVRSSFASLEAFSNLFLCFLLYFYLMERKYTEKKEVKRLFFLAGFFAFWVTQKTTVFLVAVVLKELVQKKGFKYIMNNKILWGFVAGLIVWCIYGSFLDVQEFYRAVFLRQLIFRFFPTFNPALDHPVKILIYPNVVNLWKQFSYNLGFPFLPIAVISNLFLIKKAKNKAGVLFFWFFVVAVSGSLIDYRMTRHLILGIIPLVVSLALYVNQQNRTKVFWYIIIGYIIVMNSFTNWNIINNFSYLHPFPTW